MKNYLGFALGILVGGIALLAAQSFLKTETVEPPTEEAQKRALNPNRDARQLVEAQKRISELEAQVERQAAGVMDAEPVGADGNADPKVADADNKAASFLEMMASLGEKDAQRKVTKEAERIAAEIGLSESQQNILQEALLKKDKDQKAAGIRLMTGQASLEDLMSADEDNFNAVNSAIEATLDADQLAAYEAVKEVREVQRIEKKTDEELGNLSRAADLSDEQQDAAWQVLADIYADEKPGEIPAGTTTEDFVGFIDGAIENRRTGLAPILNDEQMEVYHGQGEDFRKLVTTLIGQE